MSARALSTSGRLTAATLWLAGLFALAFGLGGPAGARSLGPPLPAIPQTPPTAETGPSLQTDRTGERRLTLNASLAAALHAALFDGKRIDPVYFLALSEEVSRAPERDRSDIAAGLLTELGVRIADRPTEILFRATLHLPVASRDGKTSMRIPDQLALAFASRPGGLVLSLENSGDFNGLPVGPDGHSDGPYQLHPATLIVSVLAASVDGSSKRRRLHAHLHRIERQGVGDPAPYVIAASTPPYWSATEALLGPETFALGGLRLGMTPNQVARRLKGQFQRVHERANGTLIARSGGMCPARPADGLAHDDRLHRIRSNIPRRIDVPVGITCIKASTISPKVQSPSKAIKISRITREETIRLNTTHEEFYTELWERWRLAYGAPIRKRTISRTYGRWNPPYETTGFSWSWGQVIGMARDENALAGPSAFRAVHALEAEVEVFATTARIRWHLASETGDLADLAPAPRRHSQAVGE
ncbi:MAG: hypothetical protein AAGF19_04665 [Pseudomonadota bacterium]